MFGFPNVWSRAYLMKVNPEKRFMRSKIGIYVTLFYYYHWVDTTAGGLLVPEGIIRPVVGASVLTTISKIHFVTNSLLINFEILLKLRYQLPQAKLTLAGFWHCCLEPFR